MSRVAKQPIPVPAGVEVNIQPAEIAIKGPKGQLSLTLSNRVKIIRHDGHLQVEAIGNQAVAGTTRALLANMVTGVSKGFERKLELVGVGYRAQAQGRTLNLTLGFSHAITYAIPEGITVETPSQTEVVVKGVDKQRVGHVASEIRAFRPPEPYKGKGVKYADEKIVRKETKKK